MQRHIGLLSEDLTALLARVGENIDMARKRRRLTMEVVCNRAGITRQTYRRLVAGEPGVSLAVMAGVLHALDLEDMLALIAAPEADEVGIALERAHKPKRIRGKKGVDDELDTDF